jgi:molybdenum cofactor sulfurtransferase
LKVSQPGPGDLFLQRYPEYARTESIDRLRADDFGRLDAVGDVYLDYTGAGLYGESQVREHLALIAKGVFGNPHSASVASSATTVIVERTRQAVLRWFNAPPDEYTAVFTLNASSALKLVGESYPFAPGGRLLLTVDNHNSVNGIREFARLKGADIDYAPLTVPELRLDRDRLDALLDEPASAPKLFAFPAQSNFSGVRHPLELVAQAQSQGWDVLLDAAAFAPTNRLDLCSVTPDFVAVSFYKMFGYPTGVGCLIARTKSLGRLVRPWFAGGTVSFATVQGRAHILTPFEAGFEDGTLDFIGIPAVEIGLRYLERVGIETIQTRVRCLTGHLLQELVTLEHGNGRPMVRIYGPLTTSNRGGTVTLNFYDPNGHLLDYRRVEELAGERRISVRTGCFCNPGAGETAEGLVESDVRAALESGVSMNLPHFTQFIQHRSGKSAGALRVSVGLATNFPDVHRFLTFAAGFRNQTSLTVGEVTFDIPSCRIIRDGS